MPAPPPSCAALPELVGRENPERSAFQSGLLPLIVELRRVVSAGAGTWKYSQGKVGNDFGPVEAGAGLFGATALGASVAAVIPMPDELVCAGGWLSV